MLNELEALRQKFMDSQNEAGIGTLSGLGKLMKGESDVAAEDAASAAEEPAPMANPEPAAEPTKVEPISTRVPIAVLPEGTKAGDSVTLIITGIDPVNQTATLTADSRISGAPQGEAEFGADRTMGPIDDLKSYLFRKTAEHDE